MKHDFWYKPGNIIYIKSYMRNCYDFFLIIDYANKLEMLDPDALDNEEFDDNKASIKVFDFNSLRTFILEINTIEKESHYEFLC